MNNKIVVFGGGTGQSVLLSGLKMFPLDITAIVSVSDDGKSTGKLRKEFNVPAVGDIRRVLVSLSETEEIIEKLINYRFKTTSDLDGHTVGNILLTALTDISGNLSSGIKQVGKVLNLKGKVLPLTDDNVTLMAEMEDGTIIEGESSITAYGKTINRVFYKEKPQINDEVIKSIKESDAIILSMGSIYTSIIPNLLCKKIVNAIDKSDAKIIYVCNMMTQPGETEDFRVSDHINLLNSYLGEKKIDVVITNSQKVNKKTQKIYETLEQKDLVVFDKENIKIQVVNKPLLKIENNTIRHDSVKLGLEIMNIIAK
ncbi:MAG: YvcK family protein [Tenericutes bacterium]|nr:YvcK family protein [Mycoplasmatota bacterium]